MMARCCVVSSTRMIAVGILAIAPAASGQRPDTIVRLATQPVHSGISAARVGLRLGDQSVGGDAVFQGIRHMAVGIDGSIYVLDDFGRRLREFDSVGKAVRTIGSSGSFPGGFVQGADVAVAPDGRVALLDFGNNRVNVYAADGTPLPAVMQGSVSTQKRGTLSAGGRSLLTQRLFIDASGLVTSVNLLASERPPRWTWERFDLNGNVAMPLIPPPFDTPMLGVTNDEDGASMWASVPFAPWNQAVYSPLGYFITGHANRYAIELHPAQSPPISIRRDVARAPVTARERDSARADVIAEMQKANPNWVWNGPDIPETKASYWWLYAGEDGRIWVQLAPSSPGSMPHGSTVAGTAPAPSLYDVFEATGTYLGQVQIPANVGVLVRRGDYVWGVEVDPSGVSRVVRLKIAW